MVAPDLGVAAPAELPNPELDTRVAAEREPVSDFAEETAPASEKDNFSAVAVNLTTEEIALAQYAAMAGSTTVSPSHAATGTQVQGLGSENEGLHANSGQENFSAAYMMANLKPQAPTAPVEATVGQYTQLYMPTFLSGREVGSVPLRIGSNKQVSLHLGSFLSLFRGKMDAEQFNRLSGSASAQGYVTLETMKAAGFSLYYDLMRERLILDVN